MILILVIAALSTGGYFGFDKYKTEDRKDKVNSSCLTLAKTAQETKYCERESK